MVVNNNNHIHNYETLLGTKKVIFNELFGMSMHYLLTYLFGMHVQ